MGFLPLHRSSHIAVSFVKASVKKVQTINKLSFFSLITPFPLRSSIYLTVFSCFRFTWPCAHWVLLQSEANFYPHASLPPLGSWLISLHARSLPQRTSCLSSQLWISFLFFSEVASFFAFCFPLRILLCLPLSFDNGKWNAVWTTTLSFISRAQDDSFVLLKNNKNNVRNIEVA